MICEQCVKENKKSKVFPHGGFTTAMYCPPFYDENGAYHSHDMNTRTDSYSCSNGHEWRESSTGSCWCGWGKEKKGETNATSR